WTAVREVVPTAERTGLDEGYLDVGEVAPDFARARVVAEAVQAAVRGATSLSCSLGVAGSKVVAKIASDRRKPGGLTVVPAGGEGGGTANGGARRRAGGKREPDRPHCDDEGSLPGLLDPQPLDDPAGCHRRRSPDRRARLRPARPRAGRPPGRAQAGRRRSFGA